MWSSDREDVNLEKIRQMPIPIPHSQRSRYSVKDLKKGGYLQYDNHTLYVDEVGRYQELDEQSGRKLGEWFELELICVETGERHALEWENDGKRDISFTITFLEFEDLRDDGGEDLDEDDLDDLCEEEDSVFYEGEEYEYDDDYPARYSQGTDAFGSTEQVHFYEFCSRKGLTIGIEEWSSLEGENYELFLSGEIDPGEIEILVLGGNES